MKRSNTQITGNIGMYYVCFKLSELGWNVMPTARNAKGIDIVAYREDGDFVGIQVKTLSKPNAIGIGKDRDVIPAEFWCIVVKQKDGSWSVFVMSRSEIRAKAHQDKKGNWWVEYAEFGRSEQYLEKWERIRV